MPGAGSAARVLAQSLGRTGLIYSSIISAERRAAVPLQPGRRRSSAAVLLLLGCAAPPGLCSICAFPALCKSQRRA